MSLQTSQYVPFHPAQCPVCVNFIAEGRQCRSYTTEPQPRPLLAILSGESTEVCTRFEPDTKLDGTPPTEAPAPAGFEPIVESIPIVEVAEQAAESIPEAPVLANAASPAAHSEARIQCQRCKTENPPNFERCGNCDANLLPAEGVGQRLGTFIGLLLAAGFLGFLFYLLFIRNTGTVPDIPIFGPVAIGGGAILALLTAFILPFRKTPLYVKYENRARRHMDLNPLQALNDLTAALDITPEKEQNRLLKQRARLFEKVGSAEDAARDYLVLATSSRAYKGEGEWATAFTGADADKVSGSLRSSQITTILKSGKAIAVGYCPRCDAVVKLDSDTRCQIHPKIKGREVQYVIPADEFAGNLAVLQKLEHSHPRLSSQITNLLDAGQAAALGYCPRCKAVVTLDAQRRCTNHPKVKVQCVQYAVPGNIEAAKRTIFKWRRAQKKVNQRQTLIVITLVIVAVAAASIFFPVEFDSFFDKLLSGLR